MLITIKQLIKIAHYTTQAPLLKLLKEGTLTRPQYEQCYEWWHAIQAGDTSPAEILERTEGTYIPIDPDGSPIKHLKI